MHHITAPIQYVPVPNSWVEAAALGTIVAAAVMVPFLGHTDLSTSGRAVPPRWTVAVTAAALLLGGTAMLWARTTPDIHQVRTIEQNQWTADQITKTYRVEVTDATGLAPVGPGNHRTEATFPCRVDGVGQTCRVTYRNTQFTDGDHPTADAFDMVAFDAAGIELPLRKG